MNRGDAYAIGKTLSEIAPIVPSHRERSFTILPFEEGKFGTLALRKFRGVLPRKTPKIESSERDEGRRVAMAVMIG